MRGSGEEETGGVRARTRKLGDRLVARNPVTERCDHPVRFLQAHRLLVGSFD